MYWQATSDRSLDKQSLRIIAEDVSYLVAHVVGCGADAIALQVWKESARLEYQLQNADELLIHTNERMRERAP